VAQREEQAEVLRGEKRNGVEIAVSQGQAGLHASRSAAHHEGARHRFKTWTGVIFVAVGYGFQTAHGAGLCPDCPEYSNILMAVGAVLAQVGLLDAANREEGPKE
jgi:hypothetical protein